MDIFHFFKKKPVLLRCTECFYEDDFSSREVRRLEKQNSMDPICPVKEQCHVCHIGFMIPVKYTDKTGKQYLFHKVKPHIKNLDPNTAMQRIFEEAGPENVWYFSPEDLKNLKH